jgi:hypothetical protein
LKWPAVESLGAKGLERNDPLVGRTPSAQFELIRFLSESGSIPRGTAKLELHAL